MPARCQSCQAPVPAGTEICESCRTTHIPRVDLDRSELGNAPRTRAPSSLRPSERSQPVPGAGQLGPGLGVGLGQVPGDDLALAPVFAARTPIPESARSAEPSARSLEPGGRSARSTRSSESGVSSQNSPGGVSSVSAGEAPWSWLDASDEVPWCGRSQDLAQLATLAEQAIATRQLRSFVVTAPPGFGKSRLLRELGRLLVAHLRVPKDRVLIGSLAGDGGAPTGALAEQIRQRCGIYVDEAPHSARDKVLRTCRTLLPAVRATEVAHLLGEILGMPFPDSPVLPAPEGGRGRDDSRSGITDDTRAQIRREPRAHAAIRRFLAADARRAPLVLLFDDMENATPEGMQLMRYILEGLADHSAGHPVIVGVFARPEFLETYPDFAGDLPSPDPLRLSLGPMPPSEAVELLAATVGVEPDELPEGMLRHPLVTAEGAPRAIVELVRLLVETQALSWQSTDRGLLPDWDLERLATIELPESLEGLVRARLSAMPEATRALLARAAVCGERFYLAALLALERCDAAALRTESEPAGLLPPPSLDALGAPETAPPIDELADLAARQARETQELLELLESQGLVVRLHESQLRGEREYRFAYPPWRQIIYTELEPALRRRYHRLIAEWLELTPLGEREEGREVIGRHLERAGQGREAARRYQQAAEQALARGVHARAPRLLLRAIACLGEGADLRQRIGLWQRLGETLEQKGDYDAALGAFEKVVRLSWTASARAQAAQAFFATGRIHRYKGDPGRAHECLARALELYQQLGDQPGIADALDDLGQVLWLRGSPDAALDHTARALELRRRLGERRKIALSLLHIGFIEQHRGLIDPAVACYDEALRKHDGDMLLYAKGLDALGAIDLLRGESDLARARFEEALGLLDASAPSPVHALLRCHLGEALLSQGHVGEAEGRLHEARELAFRLSDRRALAEIKRLLGLIHLRRGQHAQALEQCQLALDQAQQSGIRHEIGRALLALAEVHAATLFDEGVGDKHPAWEYFKRGVTLLREIGDPAELAVALAALGRHLIERGRMGPGRTALSEAEQLASRLKMRLAAELRQILSDL